MAQIPYNKPFLNFHSQLQQLKARGLAIDDENKALHLLQFIGYYRFSGYWYPLLADKSAHTFKPDANFDTAFNLYKFDRELRKLIIAELEKIEVAVRTQMTYHLSLAHGSFWMSNPALFADIDKYQSTMAKIQSEMQRSDEEFILAFKSKYSDQLPPAFITLEVASFGVLSRLYENLKPGRIKRDIAQSFGLTDNLFASWLHGLVYIRNVCAHHARLWNKLLQIQPLFPRRTANIWLTNRTVQNNHVFYVLSMIIYFLNTINPGHSFKQKLSNLFDKYPNVDCRAMGFPATWQQEVLWNYPKG